MKFLREKLGCGDYYWIWTLLLCSRQDISALQQHENELAGITPIEVRALDSLERPEGQVPHTQASLFLSTTALR
jgi:hypothetical protein